MIWQLLAFVGVIQGVIFYGHYLLYRTLVKFLAIPQAAAGPLKYVLFGMSISFLVLTFVTFRWYQPWLSLFDYASAVWLGTLFWLFLSSIVVWIVYGLSEVLGLKLPMNTLAAGFLGFSLLLSAYGLFHSYQTQVTSYDVILEGLPEYWQNKKIVLVADTHLGNVRNVKFAEKIASLIQAQKPEMVLIAGDFYDGPPTNFEQVAVPFGKIQTPKGVYFANGNHEEFSDNSVYVNALTKAGVKVLKNAYVELDGLQVVGVDYSLTNTKAGLVNVLRGINYDRGRPTVLIKHVPNALEGAEEEGIDLQVSGHTHRAQIWPMSMLVKRIFDGYHYGLKPFGNMQVITTSGAGTWGPPQRIGTNGEIVIITLKKK